MTIDDPHATVGVVRRGEPRGSAKAAIIMIHGRGASAASILRLTDQIDEPGFAYLAPQAEGNTWYPNTFLAPRASNEPFLGSALEAVDRLYQEVRKEGLRPERIMLLGFSQGACLALEYAARHPRLYGGVVGLSGGLIGADTELGGYEGDLGGSLFFLGCSDIDPHIPKERVSGSAEILRGLGAEVLLRLYQNTGHTVIDDEIDTIKKLMRSVLVA